MKYALIDAKIYTPKTGELERQNMILANGQWVGAGYVPDDEDCTVIDLKNCIIVPNVVDFSPEVPIIGSPDESSLSHGEMLAQLSRDLQLLAINGGHLHVFPVSSAAALDLIRDAKAKGLPVTCGTSASHLLYCDEDHPLRGVADRQALREAVQDGTLDVVASNPQPSSPDDKRKDVVNAALGRASVDHWVSDLLTVWVQEKWALGPLLAAISTNPKRIFNLAFPKWGLLSAPTFRAYRLSNSGCNCVLDVQNGIIRHQQHTS